MKGRALSQIGLNPYASAVSLDDRTADRQSHAHSIGFGGDEGAEQPVCVLGGDPDTAVLHGYRHLVCFVLARSDHQLARPICDCFHRFDAIDHQIDDHLLHLDTIGENHRQNRREFGPQGHPVAQQLTLHQGNDLVDDVIDIEQRPLDRGLVRERTNVPDHLGCPIALLDDLFHGAARFVQVGSPAVEPAQAGLGVGDDGSERLVHFVSDRSGQLTQRR